MGTFLNEFSTTDVLVGLLAILILLLVLYESSSLGKRRFMDSQDKRRETVQHRDFNTPRRIWATLMGLGAVVFILAFAFIWGQTNVHPNPRESYAKPLHEAAPMEIEGVEIPDHFGPDHRAILARRYRVGSPVERELIMQPLRRIIETAYADSLWRIVNDSKLAMLLHSSTIHPEVADVNFFVEAVVESLIIGAESPHDTKMIQEYKLRARRNWRERPADYGHFLVKLTAGASARRVEEFRQATEFSYKISATESYTPFPEQFLDVKLFETKKETSSDFVVRANIADLMSKTAEDVWDGTLHFRIEVDVETEIPLSIYFFEPQRFYEGVGKLQVVIQTAESERLPDSRLKAHQFPFDKGCLAVEVKSNMNEYRGRWDYSFDVTFPAGVIDQPPVAFCFAGPFLDE